jgi:hypothetical protein
VQSAAVHPGPRSAAPPLIAVTNVMPPADDGHESDPDRKVIGANGASDHLNGARV